jgi:Cu2+-exporting ATPase
MGSGRCFHCGQPVDPVFNETFEIAGETRSFCCYGCLAVCRTIEDAGLGDYYRHRRDGAVTANLVPEISDKLLYYDHPDVQRSFVSRHGPACEAALLLENVRCAACLWLNERVLRTLDGVLDVELDYTSHQARVRWDPERIRLSEILEAILSIGYVAHPYDATQRRALTAQLRRRSTERLLFAGLIGMMVMNFALAGYLAGSSEQTNDLPLWIRIGRWTSLFAVTALLAYPGQEFFVGAWHDLRNRRLGMDVPVVLGLVAAYLGSLHATWTETGEVYYDSIAMFVFLVLLARRIELHGRLQAAQAIDRASRIIPQVARRIDGDAECEVLVTELLPGDRVRVLPGEQVPTDGKLVEGLSSFDESMLTGEPVPVPRSPGDAVIGGSCNVDQPVVIEVSHANKDSTIADIHRLLTKGLREAPRYAVLAQRVATWLVGAVLLIAGATAAVWLVVDPAVALPSTIAVLIVTCPCALALAVPVVAAIGVGRLADQGVLTMRSEAVERLAVCDTFAFDKTGTLTTGRLRLAATEPFGGLDVARAMAIAAALESHSEHPIGRALRGNGSDAWTAATRVVNQVGRGIEGWVEGTRWRIGKIDYVFEPGVAAPIRDAAVRHRSGADLVVALGDAAGAGALFVLRDEVRPGAGVLLNALRRQGAKRLVLLSGDRQDRAGGFSTDLDFDEVLGDLSPADKLAWIQARQAEGAKVAMIGDGINDAPTLATADASVTFAEATQLAQANSDFIVLRNDLSALEGLRRLSGRMRHIVRQNLAWSIMYNLLAVPAAALGWIAPWGAAIGMSISSLLVVLNALRLRFA